MTWTQSKYQSFGGILDSVELVNETFRQAGENAVAVVQSADDECVNEWFNRHIYVLPGDAVVGINIAAGEPTVGVSTRRDHTKVDGLTTSAPIARLRSSPASC